MNFSWIKNKHVYNGIPIDCSQRIVNRTKTNLPGNKDFDTKAHKILNSYWISEYFTIVTYFEM